jgi:hypothetical protein
VARRERFGLDSPAMFVFQAAVVAALSVVVVLEDVEPEFRGR